MRRRLPLLRLLALCALVVSASSASATSPPGAGSESLMPTGPRWSVGAMVATYAGPSHSNLLFRTNDIMAVMGSDPGTRIGDFDSGLPVGLRAFWRYRRAISFAATYSTSSYSSAANFDPLSWSSPRELKTRLHELDLTLHYGLEFVRSELLQPYVGFGIGFIVADSRLAIDLINVNGVTVSEDSNEFLPDRRFDVKATDSTIAYLGLAGLIYHFGPRMALNAEIQGIMGDIRQTFEYDGSLQYIAPGTASSTVEDWGRNDILGGSYPLDLVGVRLSVGLLVTL
ncbi:MAG: hypothetical protein H6694_00485 [Candidatus Latescibacteria bacterium]|nr:hypothetical protein [Candidatus Latescibacterota bacterium]